MECGGGRRAFFIWVCSDISWWKLVRCSNALIPRDFRARALSVFSHGKMGAKKRASNTPSAGEKKVKKYVECLTQTEDVKAAEGNSNNLDALRKDPTRLEAMSVKELKAVMKDAGINAKGRKQDLISALGCFLKQNDDGAPSNTTNDLPVKDVTHAITSEKDIFGPRKTKGVARSQMRHCKHHEEHSGTVMKEHTHVEQVAEIEVAGSQDISLSAISEPWTILAHKKPEPGWVSYNPKTMRPPVLSGGTKSVKLISWNVNGLRALLRSGGLEVVRRENFDVLCLQETKMQEKDVDQIKDRLIDGYDNSFWTCSVSKLGYSGTAVISRIKPVSVKYGLGVQDHDGEGRLLTVEFETFYLLCAYVPNSGEGLRRLTYRIAEWDTSLSNYMKDLEKTKPVVLTGDLNCAHEEIDIYNPAGNRRSAGFTDEERQSFEKNFLSRGFVDTFRRQHPGVVGYTYWGFRHGGRKTNRGWRLDYFLVSESIAGKVHDSYILPDVVGSDHCPIGLVLKV